MASWIYWLVGYLVGVLPYILGRQEVEHLILILQPQLLQMVQTQEILQ